MKEDFILDNKLVVDKYFICNIISMVNLKIFKFTTDV